MANVNPFLCFGTKKNHFLMGMLHWNKFDASFIALFWYKRWNLLLSFNYSSIYELYLYTQRYTKFYIHDTKPIELFALYIFKNAWAKMNWCNFSMKNGNSNWNFFLNIHDLYWISSVFTLFINELPNTDVGYS